jgi:hypothetical protein
MTKYRSNPGVPGRILDAAERQAQQNLGGVNPRSLGGEMMQTADQIQRLQAGKEADLERLAITIVKQFYGGATRDVKIDAKIVRQGQAKQELERACGKDCNIPAQPKPKPAQPPRTPSPGQEQSPEWVESNDQTLRDEINKRKLTNALMQGEAKNTHRIMHMYRDRIESIAPGLFDASDKMIKTAEKMEWMMPIEVQAQMWERNPSGIGGMCAVKWEPEEEWEQKPDDLTDMVENDQDLSNIDLEDIMDGLPSDYFEKSVKPGNEPTIYARAQDFPLLIHEIVKGLYELILSRSIPADHELATNVLRNTESASDEIEDLRYGPEIASRVRNFMLDCKIKRKGRDIEPLDEYPELKEMALGELVEMEAPDFLYIMKGILMYEDEPENRQAKRARKVIDEIVERNYDALVEWDLNDKLGNY